MEYQILPLLEFTWNVSEAGSREQMPDIFSLVPIHFPKHLCPFFPLTLISHFLLWNQALDQWCLRPADSSCVVLSTVKNAISNMELPADAGTWVHLKPLITLGGYNIRFLRSQHFTMKRTCNPCQ